MKALTARYPRLTWFVLAYCVYLCYYPVADYIAKMDRLYRNDIWLDHLIPFVPAFEVWYGFILFFPLFGLFYIRDARYFKLAAEVVMFQYLFGYLIFLLYPVRMPRPVITEVSSYFDWLVHLNHVIDKPVNCFPSLHMACALSIALIIYKLNPRHAVLPFIIAGLIGVSIFLVKAHTLLDGIAGVALSLFSYFLFIKPFRFHSADPEKLHRSPRVFAYVLAIYGCVLLAAYIAYRMGVLL